MDEEKRILPQRKSEGSSEEKAIADLDTQTHWLGMPREEPPEEKKKPRRSRRLSGVIACGFLMALTALGFALFGILHYAPDRNSPAADGGSEDVDAPTSTEKIVFIREYDPDSGILTTPELYGQCADSVVSVLTERGSEKSVSSGFVLRSDGYVATAYGAVAEADAVRVRLSDGRELTAEPVGREPLCDLALLRIEAEDLSAVRFGRSEDLLVGERVLAIGAPASSAYAGSARSAEISYPLRSVELRDGESGKLLKRMSLIQTDRAWESGWAGCPLFDEYGDLVGVVSLHGEEGVGFALPADGVRGVLEGLLSGEPLTEEAISVLARPAPRLGILGERASSEGMYGVRIRSFSSGPSSAASMLKEGDLILRIDEIPVTAAEEITALIEEKNVGDTVYLTVFRYGQTLGFEVILGA